MFTGLASRLRSELVGVIARGAVNIVPAADGDDFSNGTARRDAVFFGAGRLAIEAFGAVSTSRPPCVMEI